MKNKKKKGFTLIELLAIIVILAIIAVITVPIILNIIDNSKKGAAQNSAYGYKDAVSKAYVQELAKPNNENLKLDGIYTVQNDGTLVPATGYTFGVTGYNSLPVSLSGDKPSSGSLTYSNNVLISGCLVIGDYAVTFDGNETSTAKGDCSGSSSNEQGNGGSTQNTVTPVVYRNNSGIASSTPANDVSSATDLNVGDYIKLGDDDGFYVIKKPSSTDTTVLLLAEYNLKQQEVSMVWKQSEGTYLYSESYYKTAFSDNIYWYGVARQENCIASGNELICDDVYGYLQEYDWDSQEYITQKYIYRTSTGEDTNDNISPILNDYKLYLQGLGHNIADVRLMSYTEALDFFSQDPIDFSNVEINTEYNQYYWLGSECTNNLENNVSHDYVWTAHYSTLEMKSYEGGIASIERPGIRPLIEIPSNAFDSAS